ncbi:hypothetical protein BJ741DRAFT_583438 [Chytriomyces cf. hyalinus JEL632]|nr:hypothetical protein BJ741DRAFT_583438 [Chytriomyces cf. hyalinus JEL632]
MTLPEQNLKWGMGFQTLKSCNSSPAVDHTEASDPDFENSSALSTFPGVEHAKPPDPDFENSTAPSTFPRVEHAKPPYPDFENLTSPFPGVEHVMLAIPDLKTSVAPFPRVEHTIASSNSSKKLLFSMFWVNGVSCLTTGFGGAEVFAEVASSHGEASTGGFGGAEILWLFPLLQILVKVDQQSPHVLNIKESSKSLECMKMWETGV